MNKDFEETLVSAKRDLEKNEAVHRSKPAGRRSAKKQNKTRKKGLLAGLIGALAVLLIVIALVAMNGNASLAGRWRIDDATVYEFNDDGKGVMRTSLNEYTFTYTAEGSILTIDFENEAARDTEYQYSIKGKTLTLERSSKVYKLTKD